MYQQKYNRNNPVAKQFNEMEHGNMYFCIEVWDQETDKNKRLRLEESGIRLLNTLQLNDLSSKFS